MQTMGLEYFATSSEDAHMQGRGIPPQRGVVRQACFGEAKSVMIDNLRFGECSTAPAPRTVKRPP